ncbi:hypothetical protein J3459_006177 [Metarhizium acridum]|uniref:GPI anchored serine-threonine rich protein n=1 Tax=Metarhizium acridum (strain CQMa 102) TaxID=655827 RepID=E9E205_METAQ|nr:GPI anchored serine-threonine rich protein [Metarhizium acridum CQMa 102]EFY90102.1 GPI anchored serine-threonine rich protein [Metarhizium acridum CQMa 102]KAG8418177.1 hypothetical protein J3458_005609 [Metarhizium acridum]KAG8427985.1 hypothetical protein J3459_006177 [Metarhizium acridum]
MKFLVYLAMVAVTSVSAVSTASAPTVSQPTDGDKNCLANYIVRQCLLSQNEKLAACDPADYECQCYASQAIATCYNNCPSDARAPGATQAMNGACMNASARATLTTKATSTAQAEATTAAAETSSPSVVPTRSGTSSAPSASKTNGAESLAGNAAGMLAAVAGAVAVVL